MIEVDVTALDIHDVIHVSAMKFPGNVKPIFDTDYPVVTVLPPTVAEVAVAAAPEAVEGAAVEGAAPAEGAAAAPAEGGAKKAAPRPPPRSPRPPKRRSSLYDVPARAAATTRAGNSDVRGTGRQHSPPVRCRGRGPL